MNRFRIYTGPTITNDVASILRSNGVPVYLVGVEAVYALTTREKLLRALPTWRPSDIQVLPD